MSAAVRPGRPRLVRVSLHRSVDGAEPVRPEPVTRLAGARHVRPAEGVWHLATGTLACPACDAPVAPAPGRHAPPDPLACPYCDHAGAVRDFLSFTAPSRPARVDVRVLLSRR